MRYECSQCATLVMQLGGHCDWCGQEIHSPAVSGDQHLGRVLGGRYTLVQRVGLGASSVAYRAKSSLVPRDFCVKVLDNARYSSRSEREVESLGRIRSPHVVGLVDVVRVDGATAVVMELLDGESLRELLDRRGRLPIGEALALGQQIALGLAAAHRRGVIHRDIKPSNIMISSLPSGDQFARVMDFGLAKMHDDPCVTAGFVGTASYAAPEQIRGERVTPAADLFALGCILFEMLCGRAPGGRDLLDLLKGRVQDDVERLSIAAPEFEEHVELDGFLASLMAADPRQRPRDATVAVRRLELLGRYYDQPLQDSALEESSEPPDGVVTCELADGQHRYLGYHDGRVVRLDSRGALVQVMQDVRRAPIAGLWATPLGLVVASERGFVWLAGDAPGEYRRIDQTEGVRAVSAGGSRIAILHDCGRVMVRCVSGTRFELSIPGADAVSLSEDGAVFEAKVGGAIRSFTTEAGIDGRPPATAVA